MKNAIGFKAVDRVILLVSYVYAIITFWAWQWFSVGIYVSVIAALVIAVGLGYSLLKKNKIYALLSVIIYFLFLGIYFFCFRVNLPDPGPFTANAAEVNWGSAFYALVVIYLTPFLIAINAADALVGLPRGKQ